MNSVTWLDIDFRSQSGNGDTFHASFVGICFHPVASWVVSKIFLDGQITTQWKTMEVRIHFEGRTALIQWFHKVPSQCPEETLRKQVLVTLTLSGASKCVKDVSGVRWFLDIFWTNWFGKLANINSLLLKCYLISAWRQDLPHLSNHTLDTTASAMVSGTRAPGCPKRLSQRRPLMLLQNRQGWDKA